MGGAAGGTPGVGMQAKETTIPEAQVSRGEAYFKEAFLKRLY